MSKERSDLQRLKLRDRMVQFISADKRYQLAILNFSHIANDSIGKHNLTSLSGYLLSKMMAATLLATANLKSEERIVAKLNCDGPSGTIHAEANALGEVRGYISNRALMPSSASSKAGLLATENAAIGLGTLSISKIIYGRATPVTGFIEFSGQGIIQAFADYYKLSEQIETVVKIDLKMDETLNNGLVNYSEAVALQLQLLPQFQNDNADVAQSKLNKAITNTPNLSDFIADDIYIDQFPDLIFPDFLFREIQRKNIDFFCRCNKDKFMNSLLLLGKNELQSMVKEEKEQVLQCHFCSSIYRFSKTELKELIQD